MNIIITLVVILYFIPLFLTLWFVNFFTPRDVIDKVSDNEFSTDMNLILWSIICFIPYINLRMAIDEIIILWNVDDEDIDEIKKNLS